MNVSVRHLSLIAMLVLACLGFVYLLQAELRTIRKPATDYSAMHDVDVLMYGASWCGYCAKARKVMDDQGITYFEYDIEGSKEGRRQYKELGGKGVPLFQIGGKVLKGYRPAEIVRLVDRKHMKLSATD